ncbi:MAG TPA: undecaprenyl-diphosphate phosphatase [Chthoniobacteraceae bacterium]|nr:undecaprenyl-diphosphate phosphatase [Chthoniobacteraceae bacterium]
MSYLQILILAIIQGACELLPVSSSAHVIVAAKLMHQNASSPEMTMLLILLHTGTMFAVIVYFWKSWNRDYFSSPVMAKDFVIQVIVASGCTAVVYLVLNELIKKVILRHAPQAEIEDLFDNLPLIATALAAVGLLIIYAGFREGKTGRSSDVALRHSVAIGIVQGFCIPFRGFSRSGSTISTGMLFGLPKRKLEEFSFALAVVLTPAAIAREAHRLMKAHSLSHDSMMHLFTPGLIGMVFSFLAGLLALKWLSRWLEAGRWKFFGFYCLIAAAGVLFVHYKLGA